MLRTMSEYPSGVEITEVEDPSIEEEHALRDSQIEELRPEEHWGDEETDDEDDE